MPRDAAGRSWRRRTLCREKLAVGPWGRWEIVSAVGVPRCSCRSKMSLKALALALATSVGKTCAPRFSRMDVGRSRRISLAKEARRVEGLREVVIRGRGSTMPERWEYSSSMARVSAVLGCVSS